MKLEGIAPTRNMRCDSWRCGGINAIIIKPEGASTGTGIYLCENCAKEYIRILTEKFGEKIVPEVVETAVFKEKTESTKGAKPMPVKTAPTNGKKPPVPTER